jgi:DME family drug/metabolite transporter
MTIRRGMFLVMLASTLWGTSGVASQLIAQQTPTNSLSLSFFRLFIAAPVLLLVGQRLLGKRMWAIPRRDLGLMMLIGALIGIDQALYFTAITYTGVAISTLLTICVAPIFVFLITALHQRQLPNHFTLLSIALALLGAALLIGGSPSKTLEDVSLIGVWLALCAAFGYAWIILLGRFLAGRYHPLQVNGIGFSTGAAILAGAAQVVGFVGTYPVIGWGLLLHLGLVPTALAYGLFVLGMRTTPAPIASILVMLEPLTATVLAWTFFGERMSPSGVFGAVLLISMIYVLSKRGL